MSSQCTSPAALSCARADPRDAGRRIRDLVGVLARRFVLALLLAMLFGEFRAFSASAQDASVRPPKQEAGNDDGEPSQRQHPSMPAPALAPARKPGARGGADGTAQEARRKRMGNLVGHGGPIKAITVDAMSQRVLTGSFDYAMMVWDVGGAEPKPLHRLDRHDGAVNAVAFVPGGARALAAGDDGAVSVWDVVSGERLARLEGHSAKINHLAVSADGRFAVSSSWDRTARIWDLVALKPVAVLAGHKGPVNAAQFSADGQHVYTAGYDGQLNLYRREDGAFVRPVFTHGWGINVLARVPGGELLAFGALNGAVKIVDGSSGGEVKELEAFERPVLSLAVVDKPGLLAVGAGDGGIRVFRMADWSLLESYSNPFGPVWALAFAADATALYYGGLDDFATLWTITPRQPFEDVESSFPRRFQVAGNPDDPIARGELQFARKCSVCHTLQPDSRNRAGPSLYGVFGRRIATLPGYPYSPALHKLDIVWTEETVSRLFELGPEIFTPGSKMPLQKMADQAQRDALIAYLKIATAPQAGGKAGSRADQPADAERPAAAGVGRDGAKR